MKYIVTLNGKNYEVEVEETEAVIVGVTDAAPAVPAAPAAAPSPAPAAAPSAPAAPASAADGTKVLSPMPGNILAVNVSVGAAVKVGDVLLVLEAMKMENDIVAPCDGTVKQILVQKGSTVATDDLLAVVG